MQSCGNCKYWLGGNCHRNAPTSVRAAWGAFVPTYWPPTTESQWCGQWAPTPGKAIQLPTLPPTSAAG